MSFPSTFSSFSQPTASNRLNSPSHSALHNSVSSALGQLEAVVGLDGASSVLGTLIGDLRSANSSGGGHIQSANKGGTGQTTFTKGDILVATSSSVLSRLAVSSVTGQVLTVDPNQAGGIKWGAAAASTKISAQITNVSKAAGAASVNSIYFATSILGSTFGTSNAIKYSAYLDVFNKGGGVVFTAQVLYGNNLIASLTIPAQPSIVGTARIDGYIVAASSVASQLGNGRLSAANSSGGSQPTVDVQGSQSVSSVESSQDQNLIIKGQFDSAATSVSVLTGLFVVEKIS